MVGRTFWVMVSCAIAAACRGETAAPVEPSPAPVERAAPDRVEPSPQPAPVAAPEPEPEPGPPRTIGCWEREFGTPPAAGATGVSLTAAVDGCPGCAELRVGPKAEGLHAEVLRRVDTIVRALPAPGIDEPVMWINSGARTGEPDASMHNQALAIDAVICGLDTRETAKHLRDAGFTCVIEYYDGAGNPCHFAHADLRATQWAVGAYAKGGRKARTCPKRATSRSMNCDNGTKRDWTYSEG